MNKDVISLKAKDNKIKNNNFNNSNNLQYNINSSINRKNK